MKTVTINDARAFSLDEVQRNELLDTGDLTVHLLCFEAGQAAGETTPPGTTIYQVLEGEALVRQNGDSSRLGKGRLLAVPAGTPHILENAGGGLLVVMAT